MTQTIALYPILDCTGLCAGRAEHVSMGVALTGLAKRFVYRCRACQQVKLLEHEVTHDAPSAYDAPEVANDGVTLVRAREVAIAERANGHDVATSAPASSTKGTRTIYADVMEDRDRLRADVERLTALVAKRDKELIAHGEALFRRNTQKNSARELCDIIGDVTCAFTPKSAAMSADDWDRIRDAARATDDALRDHAGNEAPSAAARDECTGLTARWCPVHGDCTCPEAANEEQSHDGHDCALHGVASDHAEAPPPPAASAPEPVCKRCGESREHQNHDWQCGHAFEPAAPVVASAPEPVCVSCNDTHRLGHCEWPCTACPTPCQACRAGGYGAYCETTPCSCACHRPAAPVVATPTPCIFCAQTGVHECVGGHYVHSQPSTRTCHATMHAGRIDAEHFRGLVDVVATPNAREGGT